MFAFMHCDALFSSLEHVGFFPQIDVKGTLFPKGKSLRKVWTGISPPELPKPLPREPPLVAW